MNPWFCYEVWTSGLLNWIRLVATVCFCCWFDWRHMNFVWRSTKHTTKYDLGPEICFLCIFLGSLDSSEGLQWELACTTLVYPFGTLVCPLGPLMCVNIHCGVSAGTRKVCFPDFYKDMFLKSNMKHVQDVVKHDVYLDMILLMVSSYVITHWLLRSVHRIQNGIFGPGSIFDPGPSGPGTQWLHVHRIRRYYTTSMTLFS